MPEVREIRDLAALRPYLFSIAYRMLGNASEAEDIVQETFLRFYAGSPDAVRSPKGYLATIVTRLCLDYLKSARVVRAVYQGPWLPAPVLTEDIAHGPEEQAEQRDDVSLAFLVLLERLTPDERAAFVLREAFDYRHEEIAAVLGTSSAATRKLVQRARQRIGEPRRDVAVSPDLQRRLTERFLDAARHGDVQRLTEVLAADVTSWVDGGPDILAARRPIHGRDRVALQVSGVLRKTHPGLRASLEPLNGAIGILWWDGDRLVSVMIAGIDDGAMTILYWIMNPAKLAHLHQRVSPPNAPVD